MGRALNKRESRDFDLQQRMRIHELEMENRRLRRKYETTQAAEGNLGQVP